MGRTFYLPHCGLQYLVQSVARKHRKFSVNTWQDDFEKEFSATVKNWNHDLLGDKMEIQNRKNFCFTSFQSRSTFRFKTPKTVLANSEVLKRLKMCAPGTSPHPRCLTGTTRPPEHHQVQPKTTREQPGSGCGPGCPNTARVAPISPGTTEPELHGSLGPSR